MALTQKSLKDLGFVPEQRRGIFNQRYKALVYRLDKTDYLYINKNSQTVFKSFVDPEDNRRYSYPVIKLGDTGFKEMQDFLARAIRDYERFGRRNRK